MFSLILSTEVTHLQSLDQDQDPAHTTQNPDQNLVQSPDQNHDQSRLALSHHAEVRVHRESREKNPIIEMVAHQRRGGQSRALVAIVLNLKKIMIERSLPSVCPLPST